MLSMIVIRKDSANEQMDDDEDYDSEVINK